MYSIRGDWTSVKKALREAVSALMKGNYPLDWRKCPCPY